MLRYALAAALGLAVVITAGSSTDAQEKKSGKTVTVEGKLVCAKCTLNETAKCENAVKVKDGEKTVVYYLDSKQLHGDVCPAGNELPVKVTGTASKKGDKMVITGAKIEKVK